MTEIGVAYLSPAFFRASTYSGLCMTLIQTVAPCRGSSGRDKVGIVRGPG